MTTESEALVTEYHGRSIHKKFNTRDKSRGNSGDKFRGKVVDKKRHRMFLLSRERSHEERM
jgi:hypothetical protein